MRKYFFVIQIIWVLAAILGLGTPARAEVANPEARLDAELNDMTTDPKPFGSEDGYVDSVAEEVSDAPVEIILDEKPHPIEKPDFHDVVFNSTLSSEFLLRYQQQFGQTEQEENYYLTSKQGYYNSPTGLTAAQQDQARSDFAQYMMRRLIEYHTENIMKTDPGLKNIYDFKQSVSNVKMDVGPQSHFDMNYSFVGNNMDIKYTSPSFFALVTLRMDPTAFTPTTPTEYLITLRKPLSTSMDFETGYTVVAQQARLALIKRLSPVMSTTLTQTFYVSGITYDPTREAVSLLGFNLTF